MINQLIDIIGREAILFESFLELLEEQKKFLVANDVNRLNKVTERQREKLVESQLLGREREELIEQIRTANELQGDVNLSRLLDYADERQTDHLLMLREVILDLNERILQTRNSNAMLLNQSREYIAKTMAMLSKISHPNHTYASDGAVSNGGANVAVDRRI